MNSWGYLSCDWCIGGTQRQKEMGHNLKIPEPTIEISGYYFSLKTIRLTEENSPLRYIKKKLHWKKKKEFNLEYV